MEPVVTLEDVSFDYDGVPVLEGVDLTVARREFLGLVGPNGGGKSTLLKIVLGLLEPSRGRVTVLGSPPAASGQRVGYVPQYPTFSRRFPISVRDCVALGRLGRSRAFGGFTAEDRARAARAMAETEVAELAGRPIGTLSGGQMQRALIARALVAEPEVLLLDEPTANIDQRGETEIYDLLKVLTQRLTVIVVSHDVGFISRYVTRVACLNRTLMCHPTDEITGETIAALYGMPVRMIHHVH
jgi:zinc transport system ATP-binding protein